MSAHMFAASSAAKEAKTLFQDYFKSVGPRTYAAQLKEAGNGNHFLVLTEGKRDSKTQELKKTRLFVFSEDFDAFFNLVENARQASRAHPVAAAVAKRQAGFWKKAGSRNGSSVTTAKSGATNAAPSHSIDSRQGRFAGRSMSQRAAAVVASSEAR